MLDFALFLLFDVKICLDVQVLLFNSNLSKLKPARRHSACLSVSLVKRENKSPCVPLNKMMLLCVDFLHDQIKCFGELVLLLSVTFFPFV